MLLPEELRSFRSRQAARQRTAQATEVVLKGSVLRVCPGPCRPLRKGVENVESAGQNHEKTREIIGKNEGFSMFQCEKMVNGNFDVEKDGFRMV